MDLTKFKTYAFVPGIASVSIAKHGMGFSKKAIFELGNPGYVKLLVNTEDKQLALVVADKNDDGAIKCMEGKDPDDNRNFRIGAKDLLHKIAYMMNFRYEDMNFKVVGEYFDDNKVMLIDLTRATKCGDNIDNSSEE